MYLSYLRKLPEIYSDFKIITFFVFLSILLKTIIIINCDIVNDDAVRYANSAYQLMRGNFTEAFSHEKMLLYTFLLGLVHTLINDWGLAGQILSVIFLTLTLIPLFFLTKRLFGARVALWAVAAFNLVPAINELASKVVKDAPFLFFMTTALWIGCKNLAETRFSSHLIIVCCAALSALFRFEGVVFLILYFFWLLFHASFRPSSRLGAMRGLICFVGILVVCIGFVLGVLFYGELEIITIKSIYLRFSQHYFKPDPLVNYHAIYHHLKSVEQNFSGGQWSNDFFELARHFMLIIYFLGILHLACYQK